MSKIKIITGNYLENKGLKQYMMYSGITDVVIYDINEIEIDKLDGQVVTSVNDERLLKKENVQYIDGLKLSTTSLETYIAKILEVIESYKKEKYKNFADYEVYSISSTQSCIGHSFVIDELAKIIAPQASVAKIDFFNNDSFAEDVGFGNIILLARTGGYSKLDVLKQSENIYKTPSFASVADFIEMKYEDLQCVLDGYAKSYGINKFLIDIASPLLPISKKIMTNSDKHIVIRSSQADDQKMYDYLRLMNLNTVELSNRLIGQLVEKTDFTSREYKLFLSQLAKIV